MEGVTPWGQRSDEVSTGLPWEHSSALALCPLGWLNQHCVAGECGIRHAFKHSVIYLPGGHRVVAHIYQALGVHHWALFLGLGHTSLYSSPCWMRQERDG